MPVKVKSAKRFLAKTPSRSPNGSPKNAPPKSGKKTKMVYYFGGGKADGDGSMKPLLGGKGANLAQMTRIGLPVPPGFTITTEVCTEYYANGKKLPGTLMDEVNAAIAKLQRDTGKKFSDPRNPL